MTDGEENATSGVSWGKYYTLEKINEMIKHQKDVYNWQFIFLAANQDAIQTGASYGFAAANSMTFSASTRGVTSSYGALCNNITAYRCSSDSSKLDFSDEDRAAASSS